MADSVPSITPYLTVKGGADALAFYVRAFGAVETCRMQCPQTGSLMHAELRIGDAKLYLGDECLEMGGNPSPQTIGGSPVTIHLQVEDVDSVFNQAVEAGVTPQMPPTDMFWGDRFAKVTDPFGHVWSLATRKEVLTPEQMRGRMQEFFASMAAAPASA